MLVRYKTFPTIFNEIDSLFNTAIPVLNRIRTAEPARGVAVKENENSISVFVELPGVAKENVKVTVHNNVLTVSAERRQPELKENEIWLRSEIAYGKFEQSINLPYAVVLEKISAVHENGILRIELPKAEEAKPKQIEIR